MGHVPSIYLTYGVLGQCTRGVGGPPVLLNDEGGAEVGNNLVCAEHEAIIGESGSL